jgi:protein-S-isoprenylcysteine O-methyltransferase Ste14
MGFIAAAYGLLCYAVFFGSFLYAIGFVGDLIVPKMIDSGPSAVLPGALAIDLVLLGLFAVQHSVMARSGFKAAWTRIVPRVVERSTYVLISSLLLNSYLLEMAGHRDGRLGRNVAGAQDDPASSLRAWLANRAALDVHDQPLLFGLRQVYLRMRGLDYTSLPFTQRAFYRFVRHPIMLGFVIAFWATPHMSVGHLVFSIATTGYILIGIFFEERDLVRYHGTEYEAYRARVPMLFPTGVKRN